MTDLYEDDEDEDEECPGADECDDADCEHRQIYEVEIDWKVRFQINAHTQEEADEIADNVAMGIDVADPCANYVEDFEQGEDYRTVEHWTVGAQRAQETRQMMAEIDAEMAAEAASANPQV